MIEDQALSVRVSGKVDSDEKNMHIATCYRILMLAKMKRGKSVMQKKSKRQTIPSGLPQVAVSLNPKAK